MRTTSLFVLCLIVGLSSAAAMAQSPLAFNFDYLATAHTQVSPTDGPTSGRAHSSGERQSGDGIYDSASATIEGGTNDAGMWILSNAVGSGFQGNPAGWTDLEGTFRVLNNGNKKDVTFTADATLTPLTRYEDGTFDIEIWDTADPDVILCQLTEEDLSEELTLESETDYGISFSYATGWDYDAGAIVDVQFSAVPEPMTMSVLSLGAVALLRRRK